MEKLSIPLVEENKKDLTGILPVSPLLSYQEHQGKMVWVNLKDFLNNNFTRITK